MLLWGLVYLALGLAPAWAGEGSAKKLIYYGWGIRDTQYIRDHWQEMEKMPFDGTGIIVAVDRSKPTRGDGATANQLGWQLMGKRVFRIEEFRDAIADLKAAKWRVFTDNFLPAILSPAHSATGLNWFDDERWRIIAQNFGVLARIALEGGLKGLILDPEHYNYTLFHYAAQRQQVARPFEAYLNMARQRGQQVMSAIAAQLPDAVLLSLFGYTLPLSNLQQSKNRQEAPYGLLPAFYDGLLEAMPAGSRLIDGYEYAYGFKERRQFLEGYRQVRQQAVTLSAVPELYRQRVKAGFGLWLDYGGKQGHFKPVEFQRAVSLALEISDEYVWIYSHGPQFFPLSRVESSFLDAIATARRGIRR
jgi:hypothetical protein